MPMNEPTPSTTPTAKRSIVWLFLFLIFKLAVVTTVSGEEKSIADDQSFVLIGLITGRPAYGRLGEVQTEFSPNEPIIVGVSWEKNKVAHDVTFRWFGPNKALAYSKELGVEAGSTSTEAQYGGSTPLAAGRWSVDVINNTDGRQLGFVAFDVVRYASRLPLRRQVTASEEDTISLDQASLIANWCRKAVLGIASGEPLVTELPKDLLNGNLAIALSIFQDGELEANSIASRGSLGASIVEALSEIRQKLSNPKQDFVLCLSVLRSTVGVPVDAAAVERQLREGSGFSFKRGTAVATLLPSLIARSSFLDGVSVLNQLAVDAGLAEDEWRQDGSELSAFQAQEFVLFPNEDTVYPSVLGRRKLNDGPVRWADLNNAIDRGVGWFVTNQDANGSFLYSYSPSAETTPKDDSCVRDLNALFVLAQISKQRPNDQALKRAVDKAIGLYRTVLIKSGKTAHIEWKMPRADSSIASTAFFLAALIMRDAPEDNEEIAALARALMDKQMPTGRFSTDFISADREGDQAYYPGETMLALMYYYEKTNDTQAKSAVVRALGYYRDYWKTHEDAPFVPWQIRAYAQLYVSEAKAPYKDYVFSLADWLLAYHPSIGAEGSLGLSGSFVGFPDSTGALAESLVAAYQVAISSRDQARENRYAKALAGNVRYLLGLQFKPEDVYCYRAPSKMEGAMAMTPHDSHLRLDFTYHAVSAIGLITAMGPSVWSSIEGPQNSIHAPSN